MIDGEHYASVVRDALVELPQEIVACVLVGGTEKLRGGEEYGVPLAASLEAAILEHAPDVVLDLSDEPVLGPPARFRLAARALALGVPYEGADFRLDPPRFEAIGTPSVAVIGTGKRVGKTAVTGHVARVMARDRRVVVVAMGRGGPAEPEVVEVQPTVADLLALSRAGRHAASDHLETAALTGLPTVGCRRCGGGLAGAVGISNVLAGTRIAEDLGPDLIVLDGSGAALPPIAAERRILVVGAHQDHAVATGYLNPYRALLADLVVVDDGRGRRRARGARRAARRADATGRPGHPRRSAPAAARRRSRPAGRVLRHGARGASRADRGASACRPTAPTWSSVSGSLSDRAALRRELAGLDADVVVVEIKAAAIDVVAEEAERRGIEVVLAGNDVVPLAGEADLDAELERLAAEAIASAMVGV